MIHTGKVFCLFFPADGNASYKNPTKATKVPKRPVRAGTTIAPATPEEVDVDEAVEEAAAVPEEVVPWSVVECTAPEPETEAVEVSVLVARLALALALPDAVTRAPEAEAEAPETALETLSDGAVAEIAPPSLAISVAIADAPSVAYREER